MTTRGLLTSRNPRQRQGRLLRKSKKKFKNARAAWMQIDRETGISPSTHRLERIDTPEFFQWRVLGRK